MDRAPVPTIERPDLLDQVCRLPGLRNADSIDWTIDVVKSAGPGVPASVYRVTGQAQVGGALVPWSLILKILHDPATIPPSPMLRFYDGDAASNLSHLMYWKREALVYQNHLINHMPGGLRAPACYGVTEAPNGDIWIWLEALDDPAEARWPVARYGDAARVLGRFNGGYLTGHPRPTNPWLSTDWLRKSVAWAAPALAVVPDLCAQRLIGRWLDPDNFTRLMYIWEARDVLLAALLVERTAPEL